MDFLRDLNSRQREAATSTEGRVRVIAGAGTGKTKALTCRYAYLVNVLGIDPANILCLTFTNKAAAQMRGRIAAMVHSGDYNDFVCTIHGFCVKFLRKEIYRLGFPKSFAILDEEDSKALAKECMDELGIKRTEKTVKKFLDGIAIDKALNGYIEAYMLPEAVISEEMKRGNLACYVSRQMKLWALDFDDLVNFTLFILDRFPDARDWWQNELNYIMVDEAQDCNTDDWNLIEKLAAGHRNLFIVGDPDQCIYEWRGSRPAKFVEFAADKDIVLDENYRSTPKILDIANSIISNNKNRIPKDLFTRKAEGRAVIHFHGKTEKEEVDWIVNQILTGISAGQDPGDFAILYRSSYLSRSVEQALLGEKLPYAVWGGTRFFERKEVKDMIAYMRLVAGGEDDISFLRVINSPSRGLGRAFLQRLKAISEQEDISLYQALARHHGELGKKSATEFVAIIEDARIRASQGTSISDLMNLLSEHSGLKKALREDQDEERLENLDELLRSVKFYEDAHEGEEVTVSDWLQDIALYTNADYRRDSSVVKLMTVHQAKGLEFPFVFVMGLSEGIFPNMRTIREYKKNGEEEERRLMYVAVTRAEKALFLTESEGFNVSTKMDKYPSRFLAEIRRETVVLEGFIPEELWKGTKNLVHVLDEEKYVPDVYAAAALSAAGFDSFASERAIYESPFRIGCKVFHEIFGEGEIIAASPDATTFQVRFSDGSTRHLRSTFLRLPDLPD